MTKFVSVPTEVKAIQYIQGSFAQVSEFCGSIPNGDGSMPAFREGNNISNDPHICAQVYDYLHETWVGVKLNQWIIRGTKGELYPCDDYVFQTKYREVGVDASEVYNQTKDILKSTPSSAPSKAVIELPIHMPGNNRNWETVAGVATVNSDGTVSVRFKELAHAEALVEMAEKEQLLQVAFDYRMPIHKLDKINSQFQMEYSDENTLDKVVRTIRYADLDGDEVLSMEEAQRIVNDLQEAGILFREKK